MNSIKTKIIISFVILLVLASSILGYFSLDIVKNVVAEKAEESLSALVKEGVKVTRSRIDTQKRILEVIAGIEDIASMDLELQRPVLQRLIKKTNFLALGVVYPDGTAYYNDGKTANLGNREYVKKAFNGETNVSDILISRVTNQPVLMYAAPIKKDGKIVGVLIGRKDGNALSNITGDMSYGQTGYAYIINDKGVIVAHKDKDRVLKQQNPIEEAKNNKKFEPLAEMFKTMIANKTGIGSYTFNNKDLYNAYTPIEGTNWIMVVTEDKSEVLSAIPKLQKSMSTILIIILIIGIFISFFIGNSLANPIILAIKHAETIAALDLTKELPDKFLKRKDETGSLAKSLKTMQNSLTKVIENIKEKSNEVSKNSDFLVETSKEMTVSSEELATTMQQVADGAISQAQDLTEIVTSLSELTNNIENVYKELQNVKSETEDAENKANIGKEEMDKLVKSIEEIKKAFKLVVGKVGNLTSSVKEIRGITDIISDISEQTNLLALNAAIEAARAGEDGRGFAVVAEEIRKLSEQTGKSTDEITKLVSTINADTNEVITTSNEVETFIIEQTKFVENTEKTFGEILSSIGNIAPIMKKTYDVMDEIVKSTDIVMEMAEQVSAVTEENSAAAEEVAASSEELTSSSEGVASKAQNLSSVAEGLMEIVNRFNI
ncbi:methyl-accepting chemotaxis protein [Crassaminicella thermophila]|uniref:Methyl-accepting chemotaxis protein n=1 Tax=Crassaminicella thermophila TaxID=2599308 RepID=A0A5C0SI76_CRATE|nr:methyl-accepting chemotaxis protein [Crassaminicella thermophila]QEK13124.1 methyl-accepting chemotaxis protein [Crassaminicella thermophila]